MIGLVSAIFLRSIFFSYEANVSQYKEVRIDQIENIKKGDIIYVGRKTCPSCSAFVPRLRDSVKKSKINIQKIYYLNIDKEKKLEPLKLKKFIFKNNIKSIPTIIVKNKNNKFLIKSFSGNANEKEIDNFIK